MKKFTLLAFGIVGLVVLSGLVVAAGGPPADAPVADRPLDGSNSPWSTDDADRLERFQERYELTDSQMDEIQAAVEDAAADGATREEIRATVEAKLQEFGVEDPVLGPPADRPTRAGNRAGTGPADGSGNGPTRGAGDGHGYGPGDGTGYGLRDGSCRA